MKLWPLVCFVIAVGAAQAEENTVYRWKDAKGQIHFSQVPPKGQRYEEIKAGARRSSGATAGASANTGLSGNVQQFLEQAETEQQARSKTEARTAAEQEIAQQNCLAATEQARLLEERGSRRLAIENEDGSLSRMSTEQFEERAAHAQDAINKHCR